MRILKEMFRNTRKHNISRTWILLSNSAVRVQLSQQYSKVNRVSVRISLILGAMEMWFLYLDGLPGRQHLPCGVCIETVYQDISIFLVVFVSRRSTRTSASTLWCLYRDGLPELSWLLSLFGLILLVCYPLHLTFKSSVF